MKVGVYVFCHVGTRGFLDIFSFSVCMYISLLYDNHIKSESNIFGFHVQWKSGYKEKKNYVFTDGDFI
jgi:hypothetical protein